MTANEYAALIVTTDRLRELADELDAAARDARDSDDADRARMLFQASAAADRAATAEESLRAIGAAPTFPPAAAEAIEHVGETANKVAHQHIWKRGDTYIITSHANVIYSGPEILAFPSDGKEVTNYGDLAGEKGLSDTFENHRMIAERAFANPYSDDSDDEGDDD